MKRARNSTMYVVSIMLGAGFTIPAFAESQQVCDDYAKYAVKTFNNAMSHPKCHVAQDARWQPNYQNHYNWCLTVPKSALNSENTAREKYLISCGAAGVL